ncbi:MAG: phosphatase PAP2 family protein [Thermoleophilia bacterium]
MHRVRPITTPGPWRELGIFALALLAYQASRAVVIGDAATALDNTAAIVDAERALGIFWEPAVQGWAAGHEGLLHVLNQFYLFAHLPVTAAFFVWVWRRRRPAYRVLRDGFLAANAIALAVFVALPVAPPRLAGLDGLDDTLRTVSGVDLHGGVLSGFFNPYAAVPSMHAGYALLVGVGVALLARRAWVRALALVYPAVVVLTIVATANHFVLDAVAGALVMALGLGGAALARRRVRRDRRAVGGAPGASTVVPVS